MAHVDIDFYGEKSNNRGLHDSFNFLMKEGCKTIYWFADFADEQDPDLTRNLGRKLSESGVKVYQHEFDTKPCKEEYRYLSKRTRGQYIHAPPSELLEKEKEKEKKKDDDKK